jgi:hypothetical protein
METYQQIKARHQAEVNAFPLGACFSETQLAEMMRQFGLPNDKSGYAQIVSLGYGCYIRRVDVPAWKEMGERHEREMKEFRKSRKELKEAFRYEFANHECQFIRDDERVCEKVGLTYAEVQNDPELRKIYDDAWKLFWKDCIDNDWF